MRQSMPALIQTNERKYELAAELPEALSRIMRRIAVTGTCWLWQGHLNNRGYGVLTCNKQRVYAHRLAYWLTNGPITTGLPLDHLCRNRSCVNPDHLQAVTQATNAARGEIAMRQSCPHGHLYTPANTRMNRDKRGYQHRQCISCVNRRNAARRSA